LQNGVLGSVPFFTPMSDMTVKGSAVFLMFLPLLQPTAYVGFRFFASMIAPCMWHTGLGMENTLPLWEIVLGAQA